MGRRGLRRALRYAKDSPEELLALYNPSEFVEMEEDSDFQAFLGSEQSSRMPVAMVSGRVHFSLDVHLRGESRIIENRQSLC